MQVSITFLGTAAGKPCATRNVSSLAVKLDRFLWVVDAGEGTQHQFMRSKLKMSAVTKIFITHLHGDHLFGLPGLLCTISAGEGGVLPGEEDPRLHQSSSAKPTVIYGPSGLRSYLRTCLTASYSILTRPYVVHELLFEGEEPETGVLHPSERKGRDVRQQEGLWKEFEEDLGFKISAGPIRHTAPCLGYIFHELPRPQSIQPQLYIPHLKNPVNATALKSAGISNPLSLLSTLTKTREPITLADGTVLHPPPMGGEGRKLVILGDTYDANGCQDLAMDADLVVHECTNAFLPTLDDSQSYSKGSTLESVTETAKSHGHSTPEVAGGFAKSVRSRMLVMNHLSVKYPDVGEVKEGMLDENESEGTERKREMIKEIGRLATVAWGPEEEGTEAIVARDFLEVVVPLRKDQE